uniref:Reverse transcriptase domain-containing protein n=1 Tax=Tanacetum cinerariifolium TaxID=118510 RepID=A0A6L2NH19_TANCI|nr:hypothetical protein [Tanacetum cinerariifolium]
MMISLNGETIKEEGEEDLHWVLQSKFEDDMANFMMEKQHHLNGLREMLDQQKTNMHEQLSQVFTTLGMKTSPNDPAMAITTRSGTTTRDLLYPASHTSPLPREQASNDEIVCKETPVNLAMIHMPKGAKFLKDLLSHKEKLEKAASSVKLGEECSAFIQKGLPQKERDMGSFTLPCLIGPLAVKNDLADLGASINLMPYSLFRKLGIYELKPTKMSIQLADRSLKYPIGVCDNLLVKINKFIFLVDFVVLEMDEDESVPIILGCPFLATAWAVIDVHDGRMSLRVGKETVTFNIRKSIRGKQPHNDYLYSADQTIKFVHDQWMDTVHLDGEQMETNQNHEIATKNYSSTLGMRSSLLNGEHPRIV